MLRTNAGLHARKVCGALLAVVSLIVFSPHLLKGQAQTLVIEGGTLIDGTGRNPVPDSVIVIEGNRIKAVGAKGKVSYPAQARVIRAEGKTVLPGLIDAHVHTLEFFPPLFLYFGVTTIYDTANPTEWILAQREALKKGRIKGPRLFVTGLRMAGPQGEGPGAGEAEDYTVHLTAPDQGRAVTRDLIRQGVDAIKVHDGLTPDVLRAVVEEAHRGGLEVVGHSREAREATEAGLKFIEHMRPITASTLRGAPRNPFPEADMDLALYDPLIDLLVKNGVYLNPTLSRTSLSLLPKKREWSEVARKFLEDPAWRFIPEARRQFWLRAARAPVEANDPAQTERGKLARQKLEEFVRRFAQAGGKVITGPDSATTSGPTNVAGLAMHVEMEALVDAGLTPMQAILSSTKWPAELLHKDKDLGTIEPGKLADLIVIEGNPLTDIRATREVRTVILDGKVVDTALDPNFRNPLPRPIAEGNTLEYMGPEIAGIAPKMAREGGADVSLEVTGEKFTPRSIVRFDTTDLATRFVSASKLTATISGALLRSVGSFAVTVVNPGSGGGTSNVKYFVVNFRD